MDYVIKNERGTYIPRIESWIMDDLGLKLITATIYALILVKGYLTWNSEYIAKVLCCDKKTIQRNMDILVEKDVIAKENIKIKGKTRWILVSKYTIEGKRPIEEIQKLMRQGREKLQILYEDKKYKRK